MTRSVLLGLDGGGTKTECVAIDADLEGMAKLPDDLSALPELSRGSAPSTNWNSVGPEAAHTHFRAAIDTALAAAQRDISDVAAIGIGMSGVDRPDDRARVQGWLDELLPGRVHVIENDGVAALAAGTGGRRYGIVLISGTGMIALGFDATGKRVRAGGWGALLGDGGSGYAIGAAILRAFTWAADGRGPQTSLVRGVMDHLRLENPQQLVRWTYDDIAWHRFSALAPLAVSHAEAGDPVANGILDQAADDLAVAVQAVAAQLNFGGQPFPLVMAGGNLRLGPLADRLTALLVDRLPAAQPQCPRVDPCVGAALLAWHVYKQ